MDITFAFLADAANRSDGGKLNVLGIFQGITARDVPTTHAQMYLVIGLKAAPAEKGMEFTLKVILSDQDGKQVAVMDELRFGVPSDSVGLTPESTMLLDIKGLVLPDYGNYVFNILLNGRSDANVPLIVQPPPPQHDGAHSAE